MLKTFYNINSLIRFAKQYSSKFQVFSFDLFDTILIRRVHDPELTKIPVARYIAKKAQEYGLNWSTFKVLRFRNKVEAMHRRRTGKKYLDKEACYPCFMKDVLQRVFKQHFSEALQDNVTRYELDIEKSMLVPRSAFMDLLRYLSEKNKKIIAVSDMYLPADYLKQLLNEELSHLIDEVISSADTFCAKASGAAWKMIMEKYKFDPKTWLHIGDNPISDGYCPAKAGISALVLKDVGEKMRKAIVRRYWKNTGRPFWHGRLLQQLMLPIEAENIERNKLYAYGYNFFAPMLCAFIHHVANQCIEQNIKRIYFFSREGDIFLEIWNRIIPFLFREQQLPEAHYLYVSRLALAGASCAYRGLKKADTFISFLPVGNRDMRDICRVFSLNISKLYPFLDRVRLKPDEPISPLYKGSVKARTIKLQRLLKDPLFQDEIKQQTMPSNDALQRYLESEDFFKQDKVALVDIGWLGTIQRFLHQAVEHRTDAPDFHGFVFAFPGGYSFPHSDNNKIEGFVYDYRSFSFAGSIILYALNLFEDVTRAAHPGLVGYTKDESGFKLKFRNEDDTAARAEKEQSAYYAPLKQGILDAASRYGPATSLMGVQPESFKPWLHYLLISHLAFPSASEVGLLRHSHHMDDFAGNHKPPVRWRRLQSNRLWNQPVWMLRVCPLLKLYYYIRHAVGLLRH